MSSWLSVISFQWSVPGPMTGVATPSTFPILTHHVLHIYALLFTIYFPGVGVRAALAISSRTVAPGRLGLDGAASEKNLFSELMASR